MLNDQNMMKREKHNKDAHGDIRVGISHGDFNGVGYEVILKTLADSRITELCTPVIYGSSKIASYHKKTIEIPEYSLNVAKRADQLNHKRVNVINCFNDEAKIELGKSTTQAGTFAFQALERVLDDIKNKRIDVLVTAPINKKNIQSDKFKFPGHTEYLAKSFNAEKYLMLMVCNEIRIGTVTGHVPLSDVQSILNVDLIMDKLRILNDSLKKDFAIRRPKIAVLSFNPHAGDAGLLGKEEDDIIIPAIKKANNEGILAMGPFAADGFFGSSQFKNYDAILAMYHDQGLIPFKTLAFEGGVNFTAGLSVVRTSPAHGTAYDIAGKNKASEESFRQALYLALDIFRNRSEFEEINKNPLGYNLVDDSQVDEDVPEDMENQEPAY